MYTLEDDVKNSVKWDLRFLKLADHISSWSKDPSTKTGAVIVNDLKHIVSVGYNGFPRGMFDDEEKYKDRETKLKYICHADVNAVYNAYTSVMGCTIYLTHPPCNECQKTIVQSGIKKTIFWKPSNDWILRWGNRLEVFDECGMIVNSFDRNKSDN